MGEAFREVCARKSALLEMDCVRLGLRSRRYDLEAHLWVHRGSSLTRMFGRLKRSSFAFEGLQFWMVKAILTHFVCSYISFVTSFKVTCYKAFF